MRRVYAVASRVLVPAGKVAITPLGIALSAARMLTLLLMVLFSVILLALGQLVLLPAGQANRWRFGLAVMNRFMRSAALLFGVRVVERGHRPPPGSLVVTNHRSYMDIVALGSVNRCFFLSKAELASWPLLGWGARWAGVAFVERDRQTSRIQALAEVDARLQAGFTLVNFPEGTTSADDRPLPFRPGLFRRVAGSDALVVPGRIDYAGREVEWVADATFLDHLFKMGMRPINKVRVAYARPLAAADWSDGDALCRACYQRVCRPEPAEEPDVDEQLAWLRKPWRKHKTHGSVRSGRYRIEVFDQPGRWMSVKALAGLHRDLLRVAAGSLDEVPRYGLFTGQRAAYANRVIAVAYRRSDGAPVGFTAMVYLPLRRGRKIEPVVHLGLTMIRSQERGQRLQTPLFKKVFMAPIVNQLRLRFTVTNIAASPAGIGAISDYMQDVYPTYHGSARRRPFHRQVAEQMLAEHRHEFGCSSRAVFEPETFVVRGSNDPAGEGAHQFIKSDPVSRYRVEACNSFCRQLLDFEAGDELFQVGRVDLLKASWASRQSKRKLRAEARPAADRQNADSAAAAPERKAA